MPHTWSRPKRSKGASRRRPPSKKDDREADIAENAFHWTRYHNYRHCSISRRSRRRDGAHALRSGAGQLPVALCAAMRRVVRVLLPAPGRRGKLQRGSGRLPAAIGRAKRPLVARTMHV